MINIKRLIATLAAIAATLCIPAAVHAYNVVDLPESMTFDEAFGIFSASDITRATISNSDNRSFIELSREEIDSLYENLRGMSLTRRINPTPFRGTSLNLFTEDNKAKSYYVNSGIELGLYGNGNYICYAADSEEDRTFLTNIETMYQDSSEKQSGDDFLYRSTGNDFLILPADAWAQTPAREAAANNLLPYEFTKKYTSNISREEFCILLGNLIKVVSNSATLDDYLSSRNMVYYTSGFSDCENRDHSIFMLNALGIVSGKDESNFDPDGALNREEAAALLCRTAEQFMYISTYGNLNFADAGQVSPWARYFATWVSEQSIMNGSDGYFRPKETYTVIQAITSVNRLYKVIDRTLGYN